MVHTHLNKHTCAVVGLCAVSHSHLALSPELSSEGLCSAVLGRAALRGTEPDQSSAQKPPCGFAVSVQSHTPFNFKSNIHKPFSTVSKRAYAAFIKFFMLELHTVRCDL
jgi:hypothetical protein